MYILADIGGTKTRIAASDDLERFSEPHITQTPADYGEFIDHFSSTVRGISAGKRIDGMIIGKPLWKDRPTLGHDIQSKIDAPLHVENDTVLVGLGEAVYGAGQDTSIFVYITVSTGVNGVRIINRKIDVSKQGFEMGGQYLSMGKSPQTLEDLVSGTAVAAQYKVASPVDLGKDNAAWEELAQTLAFGVHNSILHWSPERVALGGSMFNEIGISVDRVKVHVEELMKKFPVVPEIVRAELKDLGGLYGGMVRLRQLR